MIQAMTFEHVIKGKTCILADQSGSGKTLAYLAPLIQRLRQEEVQGLSMSSSQSPRVIILVPTAELASQVSSIMLCFITVLYAYLFFFSLWFHGITFLFFSSHGLLHFFVLFDLFLCVRKIQCNLLNIKFFTQENQEWKRDTEAGGLQGPYSINIENLSPRLQVSEIWNMKD